MTNPKLTADANWYSGIIETNAQGFGAHFIRKNIGFTGAANLGAIGAVPLFTVTGAVLVRIIAICTEDLVCGAGATLSVGTAAATAGMLAVTGAADIDVGDIWFAAAPVTKLDTLANAQLSWVIGDGASIKGTVAVDTITDGNIDFNLWWSPLGATGNVVAVP
jgi:hypothetical protein